MQNYGTQHLVKVETKSISIFTSHMYIFKFTYSCKNLSINKYQCINDLLKGFQDGKKFMGLKSIYVTMLKSKG